MKVVLLFAAALVLSSQELPEAPSPAGRLETWEMRADGGNTIHVWGRGRERPRIYFSEYLPALFERTLRLDHELPEGTVLDWIFTGPEGGVTVRLTRSSAELTQRYYDSLGLGTNPPKARFPERTWDTATVPFTGTLRTVTLRLDHKMGLELLLNGRSAARQRCMLDLQRSQLAVTGSASLRGSLESPAIRAAQITINPAQRYQTMLGFGGITSLPSFHMLSPDGKERWWQLLREYNLLLHREYPNGNRLARDASNFDRMADAVPHYYGDNFPNSEISDFDYLKQIRKLGGKVVFEFWELPSWARQADGSADPDKYVEAMLAYCRASVAKTGAPPEIVGVQNEITQPPAIAREMTKRLRDGLDRAGFKQVRIHMANASNLERGIKAAHALKEDAAAWHALDYTATNVYDFQSFFTRPDEYDARISQWAQATRTKPFLSTEISVNSSEWQSDSYRTAFMMAQLYHKNLVQMDAAAILYCWLLLDVEQPSFGATRSLFVPDRSHGFVPAPSSHQLRVFGAFSRHVREGMQRIEATSDQPDLLVSAYERADKTQVLVLVNRGVTPLRLSPGRTVRLERVSQYSPNLRTEDPILQPGEILTEIVEGPRRRTAPRK